MPDIGKQNISSPARPVVLSLLCIITFITGFFKIALFFWATLFSNQGYSGKNINGFLNLFLGISSTLFLIIWMAVTLFAMAGAGLMWKLKKSGFYIYAISACFTYILPAISSGAGMMTIQRLFFAALFLFLYGIHLKFMKWNWNMISLFLADKCDLLVPNLSFCSF